MNYKRIYTQIVERAKSENRKKKQGTYYEAHHIIPKCMGGEGKTSNHSHPNIVLLTAKEHYICHKLLCKIYPDNKKIIYAFWRMINSSGGNNNRYTLSSRAFEKTKKEIKQNLSGRIFSIETKKKMSDANRNRAPISAETRKKFSDNVKGKLNPGSRPEVIAKRINTMNKKVANGIYSISGKNHSNYKGIMEEKTKKYKGGAPSSNATIIEVDGSIYNSYREAGRVYGIAGETVSRRCKSNKYVNWKIIKEFKK